MAAANALIFVPIGFFTNLLWRRPRWWKGMAVGFCVSLTIEFLQLFVNRSTDVDDLILNTTGAFLGGLIALLLGKLAPKLTRKFQVEVRHGRETGDPKPAPGAGAGQSDYDFDHKLRRLEELEAKYPELITSDSPTQRVGGKVADGFAEVHHRVPLESLQDVFSFEELADFGQRVQDALTGGVEYDVEPKVDGLSVAPVATVRWGRT